VTDGLDQPAAPESLQDRSARTRARSVRQDEGVDAFQAFQRVLYRSAKQDPERRFHALYDKLSRRDVMYYSPEGFARSARMLALRSSFRPRA